MLCELSCPAVSTRLHLLAVVRVDDDEFPVKERNALELDQLMIESVREEMRHPPGRQYGHHDRHHVRQIVGQLDLHNDTPSCPFLTHCTPAPIDNHGSVKVVAYLFHFHLFKN